MAPRVDNAPIGGNHRPPVPSQGEDLMTVSLHLGGRSVEGRRPPALRRAARSLALLACAAGGLLATSDAAAARRLTPADYHTLRAVGDVAIAPDGSRVAYTVRQYDAPGTSVLEPVGPTAACRGRRRGSAVRPTAGARHSGLETAGSSPSWGASAAAAVSTSRTPTARASAFSPRCRARTALSRTKAPPWPGPLTAAASPSCPRHPAPRPPRPPGIPSSSRATSTSPTPARA